VSKDRDNVDEILKRYSLKRDTARKYVEAVTTGNGKETAEQIGVSRRTVTNYKQGFKAMSEPERAIVLSQLTKELYDEVAEEAMLETGQD